MSFGNNLPSQPNIHLGKLNQKPISITLVGTDDEFPEKGLWHLIFFRREVWPQRVKCVRHSCISIH